MHEILKFCACAQAARAEASEIFGSLTNKKKSIIRIFIHTYWSYLHGSGN